MDNLYLDKMMDLPIKKEAAAPPKQIYDCNIGCNILSGEAKVTIDTDGLLIDTLFEQYPISYADITDILIKDYKVHIYTSNDKIVIDGMGQSCSWFYGELSKTYRQKVLKAFGIQGKADFETNGQYSFTENKTHFQGTAQILIYPDCICLLPLNGNERRFPVLFINSMKSEAYTLKFTLRTGEYLELSKLGYDFEPLEKKIKNNIHSLWETKLNFIKSLDNSLGLSQASKAARLMPEGLAVPVQNLNTFPSLAQTVESKVHNSKIGDTVKLMKNMCDSENLCIGIKAVPPEESDAAIAALLEKMNSESDENAEYAELSSEQKDAQSWIVWVAIPSNDHSAAVVEFSFPCEDTATYLFSLDRDWKDFLTVLNRAFDATGLKREIIALPESELQEEKYNEERMLVGRTSSIYNLRSCFAGRVIHRSIDSWITNLKKELMRISASYSINSKKPKFCGACGEKLTDGIKFCGKCGAKK